MPQKIDDKIKTKVTFRIMQRIVMECEYYENNNSCLPENFLGDVIKYNLFLTEEILEYNTILLDKSLSDDDKHVRDITWKISLRISELFFVNELIVPYNHSLIFSLD